MKRKTLVIAIVIVLLLGVLGYFYGGHSAPAGQPPLAALNASNLEGLKAEFNASEARPRLIVMLSPT